MLGYIESFRGWTRLSQFFYDERCKDGWLIGDAKYTVDFDLFPA